ncbi:MAG: hypothetical protein D6755_09325, partial [Anaerolineae bacterium]
PSGHGYCDSKYAEAEVCSTVDLKLLTHAGDPATTESGKKYKRKYGGADIYARYEEFRNTPGWWNDNKIGVLTPEEFFGLYILFEAGGDPETADAIATVFAQNLYVGGYNPATCKVGGVCSNAVFNFIASQIDGGSSLLKDPQSDAIQLYGRNHHASRAQIQGIGFSAVSPDSVVTWDRNAGPSTWGNIKGGKTLSTQYHIPTNVVNGTASNTVYYFVPSNFVIMSINQVKYWQNLNVDMSLSK